MRVRIVGTVLAVIASVGLVAVSSGTATGAATSTVGTTKLGVGGYAGNDPNFDYKESIDHDGNLTLSGHDSDTGEDDTASASATLSSTASSNRVTLSGTATTYQSTDAAPHLYPASVTLDTTLGEDGQWVFVGSYDVTASSATPDGCITGSVTVRIYPPGDTAPSYNGSANVSGCTAGAGHETFGDLGGMGVALEAGTLIRTSGGFSSPNSFASGTSSASFSVVVHKKLPLVSNISKPSLTGSGVVGSTLRTSTGTWASSPDSFTYQWSSGGADVPGATSTTYVVRSVDVKKVIQCYVTASRGASSSSQFSSAKVGRAATLGNIKPPRISGKFVVGKKLTASAGKWAQRPTKVTYQWLRNGHAIKGAHKSKYKLKSKDKGKKVSVRVTASAPKHADGHATSRAKKVKAPPKRR